MSKSIVWVVLGAFTILSVCFLLLSFNASFSEIESLRIPDRTILSFMCFAQLAAFLAAVNAWRATFSAVGRSVISVRNAMMHIGLMLLTKYTPGKVWGLVARGVLIKLEGFQLRVIIDASLLEQAVLCLTGGIVGVGFYVAFIDPLASVVVTLCLIALSWFLWKILLASLAFFVTKIKFLKDKADGLHSLRCLSSKGFFLLCWSYYLQWVVISLVVVLIAKHVGGGVLYSELVGIAGALILAVLIGFFAVFVPGGIGVREGFFVLMLSPFIPINEAIAIGLYHRLWVTLYDLAAGLVAGLLYRPFSKEAAKVDS